MPATHVEGDSRLLLPAQTVTEGGFAGAFTGQVRVEALTLMLSVKEAMTVGADKLNVYLQTSIDAATFFNSEGFPDPDNVNALWIDALRFNECKGGDEDVQSWICLDSSEGDDAILSTEALGERQRRHLFGEFWRIRWTVSGGSFNISVIASALG